MTTFEITIVFLLAAIVVLLIVLLRTAIEGFHGVWQKFDANWEQLRKIETHTNFLADISRQLDNIEGNAIDEIEDFTRDTEGILSDLAINVKGNYNTLEQQQEDIQYIRERINHILSLMHPTKENIKQDVPTALDGLRNVQKDNANKSTNYNGYDPTFIVKGSETTNKED